MCFFVQLRPNGQLFPLTIRMSFQSQNLENCALCCRDFKENIYTSLDCTSVIDAMEPLRITVVLYNTSIADAL